MTVLGPVVPGVNQTQLDVRKRDKPMRYRLISQTSLLFVILTSATHAAAQENLAKQSQNPLATVVSLPFENNTHFDVGPSGKIANAMLIKPVYPITLGNWNLVNRFIAPLIYLEGQDASRVGVEDPEVGGIEVFPGTSSEFGLGNIQYQAFFSPAKASKWIWGIGPVLELPTNTDDSLGSDTWSLGPTAVALTMPGNWVIGVLAQNLWDISKGSGEPDVSRFTFQYFINYNLADGWYLSSAPVTTADWEASSGNRWTVPVGGGVGRLVRFGNQPVDFRLAGFWNADKPKFGPEWDLQFTVKFLFPK